MPRSQSLIRLCALAALVALASGRSAPAQDDEEKAKKAAQTANGAVKKLQQMLAEGKDAEGKDAPTLKQLRIDGFVAKEGKVEVRGVYLSADGKLDESRKLFGTQAQALIVKALGLDKEIPFVWDAKGDDKKDRLPVYGTLDKGKFLENREPPHVRMQDAANKAGADRAAADQVFLTGSRFGPNGELVVSGFWGTGAAADKGLSELWLNGVLAKHPPFWPKSDLTGEKPTFDLVKLDPWPILVPKVREALAKSDKAAFRRTRVDRVFLRYDGPDPTLTVTGVRLGRDDLTETEIPNAIKKLWPALETVKGKADDEITAGLADPAAEIQVAVAAERELDGLRVDPGAAFSAEGDVLLAGLRPEQLTAAQAEKLTKVFQTVVKAKADGTDATAPRYARLRTSKVSADGMRPIALGALETDLRQWALKYRDDIRFRRLLFAPDSKKLEPQYYSVAPNGGGLVLVYQAATEADLAAVAAEFQRAFVRHFPKGLGETPDSAPGKEKEPLLPGLTAELRKIMTADQKEWYGVLIERGYFDIQDRYTLTGVVNSDEQNTRLQALLKRLSGDARWKPYFHAADGTDQQPLAPKLVTIPMDKMVARVQRVMPAHPEFDGIRVESAYYDPDLRLTFRAHAVGRVTPAQVGQLAELLTRDPLYTRRVVKPEGRPPLVRIAPIAGPAYADDQLANFSLGFGASLLAKAGESKEAKTKAKEWLDVALLHYPNESAVWFLSAYYHFTTASGADRDELVKRDLYRTVAMEGPLSFNGPAQRKRRYDAAKDLQGSARADLEALWLEYFREVKDGAKPITLSGK